MNISHHSGFDQDGNRPPEITEKAGLGLTSGGPKYPQLDDTPRKEFACPFHRRDPLQYRGCEGKRFPRISDVTKHIARRHQVRKYDFESSTTYCAWCRHKFVGPNAEKSLSNHATSCEASIQQTGLLLPEEFSLLRSAVAETSGSASKWYAMWRVCFPAIQMPSPYVEAVVPQPQARRILQDLLASSAANPWTSEEIRQSTIDKALSAIYYGLPFTETEPDESTVRSDTSDYEESTFSNQDDSSSSVARSFADPYDMELWTGRLKIAVLNVECDKVHSILENSFEKVAVGEYLWLLELKSLGLSAGEIADELLERSQVGPWIYSKIDIPNVGIYRRRHNFHISRCLHSQLRNEAMPTAESQLSQHFRTLEPDSENSVREAIQYLCGIGGVSPMHDGSQNIQFGSVVFENANSTAIVSLMNTESVQAVGKHLEKAIGALQQVGGCCDSFTFLARQALFVELERIEPGNTLIMEHLISLTSSKASFEGLDPRLLDSLTAQFLSLAFALYAQGHCEPFTPFFLDTSLKRILLIGNQIWGSTFSGPCILASPVELSCFGGMVQRRVFAFQYFNAFDRSKVFSDPVTKFDLKARPEDLLDTWGPGDFIVPKDDQENLHAISIGGGLITSSSTGMDSYQLPVLHWSRASGDNTEVTSTFPRHEKMVIGSRVSINQTCRITPQEQVRKSIPWLKELGTFPSYWEVSERQLGLGLQAGNGAVGTLNFAQTWVKRLGQTKKSNILAKRSLSIADLEGPFAVQVSFCTGIARRVQLRELLADILPVYVADLATQPCNWKRLQDCNICKILRDSDFRVRYQKLDRELQAEFETLAIAVLFLLQDTGVDRKGENFVVGCIPPGSAVQCFKIPIEKESFWARILTDSDDVATFAYAATSCFETDLRRCRGPKEQWKNATALFSTAVSLCHDHIVAQGIVAQQTRWALKDSESYLLGRVDEPLLVRVIRPNIQDEPELLVSMSTIIAPFLRRWSRKQGYKRPWRLRESRAIDHQHQMAESVVVTTDFENSW